MKTIQYSDGRNGVSSGFFVTDEDFKKVSPTFGDLESCLEFFTDAEPTFEAKLMGARS